VDRVFTHRFRLEQAEEAYRLFDTQTTGTGVFTFEVVQELRSVAEAGSGIDATCAANPSCVVSPQKTASRVDVLELDWRQC
jgi:hypothetical protein